MRKLMLVNVKFGHFTPILPEKKSTLRVGNRIMETLPQNGDARRSRARFGSVLLFRNSIDGDVSMPISIPRM
jgi:hypothetical protein